MSSFVGGCGNPYAKLMIIGEAPGATEDSVGEPFVGSSGEFLDGCFYDIKKPNWRSEYYVTNVFKYRPPYNDIKRIHEVCNPKEQIDLLWKEISQINPNAILALGNTPLQYLCGLDKILKYRGSILPSKYGIPKVIPSIHPSALLRVSREESADGESKGPLSYIWRRILIGDIEKAIEEAEFRDLKIPERYIKICQTSSDLNQFIREGHSKDRVYLDVETFSSTLVMCVGLSWDGHSCLVVPLFQKVNGKQISSIPYTDLSFIWQLLQQLFDRWPTAGANLKFDLPKLQMLGFTFPKGIKSDLMLKARTVNPEIPRVNLGFLTSIYTRQPYHKDEGKEFIFGKDRIDDYYRYNGKDVCNTGEIDLEMEAELEGLCEQYNVNIKSFYYEFVVPQHELYCDLERLGVRVDSNTRDYLIIKYEEHLKRIDIELSLMLGSSVNFRSPKQLNDLLFGTLRIPTYKIPKGKKWYKTDEDVIAKLLRDTIKDFFRRRVLELMLERRKVTKVLDTYLYADLDTDGRIRTQYNITGTENGRTSTSIIDPPIRPFECGWAFQTAPKHNKIGGDVRSMLVPDDGFIFVNIDKSQAEARVVAHLANDIQLRDAFDFIDLHRRTARCALIDGVMNLSYEHDPIADKIGKDSPERFLGKKVRHATNYDMGWKEFMTNVITEAHKFGIEIIISKFSVERMLQRIHDASPNTRAVFHSEIKECLNNERCLINPFGRIRRFYGRYDDRLYKEGYAAIPQSTVKDDLTRSLLQVRRLKFPIFKPKSTGIAIESHDNGLFQMPINEYVDICKEIKPIMMQEIDFSQCSLKRGKLVIPVEFEVGYNLKDLEKLKLQ